jgi:hypothetical protein
MTDDEPTVDSVADLVKAAVIVSVLRHEEEYENFL